MKKILIRILGHLSITAIIFVGIYKNYDIDIKDLLFYFSIWLYIIAYFSYSFYNKSKFVNLRGIGIGSPLNYNDELVINDINKVEGSLNKTYNSKSINTVSFFIIANIYFVVCIILVIIN